MNNLVGFEELVYIGQDGHFHIANPDGSMAVEGSTGYGKSLDAILDLMRQTGASAVEADHMAMAAAVREPIRLLARYMQWTPIFFADWPLGLMDDNRIPVDQPLGAAFMSSPEGRPLMITPGVQQYVRPNWFEITSGLRIHWKTLQTAGWPILRRRMEEASDDMARRFDAKAKAMLEASVAVVTGHVITVTGGKMSKAAIDKLVRDSTQTGFPAVQAAVNPSRLMDMTDWTNGSPTALPYFFAPESRREQVFTRLWADGYANLRWEVSHSVPMNEIWFSGDAEAVGYHQNHGQATSVSVAEPEERADKHWVTQEDALYVGNPYNVWKMIISA